MVIFGNVFGSGGEGYVRISLIVECKCLDEVLNWFKKVGIYY